jgi:hypothetical protein
MSRNNFNLVAGVSLIVEVIKAMSPSGSGKSLLSETSVEHATTVTL